MAPDAVNVAVPALQIVCGVTLNDGTALTVTVVTDCFEQPFALVPVTEYVVVTVGDKVAVAVRSPDDQVYVDAPDTVKVVALPLQIVFVPLTVSVGKGLTVTENVVVFVHPLASVPVTVYVVLPVGVGEIVLVVAPPGDHV